MHKMSQPTCSLGGYRKMVRCSRRIFVGGVLKCIVALASMGVFLKFPGSNRALAETQEMLKRKYPDYTPSEHYYSFIVDTQKCIGCGKCVKACRDENEVPDQRTRTWVERVIVRKDGGV